MPRRSVTRRLYRAASASLNTLRSAKMKSLFVLLALLACLPPRVLGACISCPATPDCLNTCGGNEQVCVYVTRQTCDQCPQAECRTSSAELFANPVFPRPNWTPDAALPPADITTVFPTPAVPSKLMASALEVQAGPGNSSPTADGSSGPVVSVGNTGKSGESPSQSIFGKVPIPILIAGVAGVGVLSVGAFAFTLRRRSRIRKAQAARGLEKAAIPVLRPVGSFSTGHEIMDEFGSASSWRSSHSTSPHSHVANVFPQRAASRSSHRDPARLALSLAPTEADRPPYQSKPETMATYSPISEPLRYSSSSSAPTIRDPSEDLSDMETADYSRRSSLLSPKAQRRSYLRFSSAPPKESPLSMSVKRQSASSLISMYSESVIGDPTLPASTTYEDKRGSTASWMASSQDSRRFFYAGSPTSTVFGR
ncbi:uncharacterized protein EV422DRAFT_52028 [Fimicolochytrium jonesii]|uniref:uncharacterized protein n=1 Tax=Fimicolochytrium jonesii TaxID=1396493 RepID=UPI0022FDC6B5|nr:uncharacterized protein EV422DRAFT_52028 [Fimicolochytrium jonesii]KAI8821088.1 hypothetical protein EV422DRAFT_52028 [Fimicolochytrium jonesii]